MNSRLWLSNIAMATYITFLWFLSSMKDLMKYTAFFASKGLSTHITFIWLLSSMNSLMNFKLWLSSIAMDTYIPFISFLSSMKDLMKCTAFFVSKGLSTHITFIWFLSSMSSLMNCYIQHLELIILAHKLHLHAFLSDWTAWCLFNDGIAKKKVCHSCYTCKISLQYEFSDDF